MAEKIENVICRMDKHVLDEMINRAYIEANDKFTTQRLISEVKSVYLSVTNKQ